MTNTVLKEISIANLIINPENFRYEPVDNQRKAIEAMVKDKKVKIDNLAEDIAIYGLNPSEFITIGRVHGKNNIYLVLEGNRRVTALKLLNQPKLLEGIDDNKKKKFIELQNKYRDDILNKVMCVVYEDHEEAYKWIELKHTGSNSGVGVVEWGPPEKQRFLEKIGKKPTTVLQVIDYVKGSGAFDNDTKTNIDSISTTNLQRLLDDPDVRKSIGIDMKKGEIKSIYPDSEVAKGLSKIIDDLASGTKNVKDIYYKEDRKRYLETFTKSELPDESIKTLESRSILKDTNNRNEIENQEIKKDTNKSVVRGQAVKNSSTNRQKLIPGNFSIRIDKPRINDIFRELKSLNIQTFTNSVAVLFRVFIELSSDEFIEIIELDNLNNNITLSKKVQSIAEYMHKGGYLNKEQLRPINKSISSPESILSFTTLNAYVHNKEFYPSPNELKITWNNMQIFIEKMWHIIQEVGN